MGEVPGFFFLYGGEGVGSECSFLGDRSVGVSDDGGGFDL